MSDSKPMNGQPDSLTREEFYGFLQHLHLDDEQAALKYEELHWKLVKFFAWSFCSSAEDLADETLNRIARKVHDGEEILDLEAFVWGVAKRIRQEQQKKNGRTVPLSDVLERHFASDRGASADAIQEKLQRQNELRCLRACLGRLRQEDQELFLAYRVSAGHYLEERRKLAQQLGLAPGALRVRVLRLREKLEKCLARCLGK